MPEAASGWPIATAPPLTLTRSGSMPSAAQEATTTPANASLISHRSMSAGVRPLRSSSLAAAEAADRRPRAVDQDGGVALLSHGEDDRGLPLEQGVALTASELQHWQHAVGRPRPCDPRRVRRGAPDPPRRRARHHARYAQEHGVAPAGHAARPRARAPRGRALRARARA